MTNQQQLITPSLALVQYWVDVLLPDGAMNAFTVAAQWGADQELAAIFEMVGQQSLPEEDRYLDGLTVASIRATRRPKPPSLKEQALAQLRGLPGVRASALDIIRRALEQLND